MKTREEVARFVENQFDNFGTYNCPRDKGHAYHYGRQDVKVLLDFIYEGPPITEDEKIKMLRLKNGHRE